EVFKPGIRVSAVAQETSAKRPSVPVDKDGIPALGCPMLTRTRVGMPTAAGAHVPRCALAWALHSEEEAGYCMETPLVALCWKLHPEERIAEIDAKRASRAAD
ncbi:MAG TPA: hypothetical protein VEW66_06975, partial [Thermomicrobiales bacterium]|nr:hypothetical protein [Thermomicrobiales bacterium]